MLTLNDLLPFHKMYASDLIFTNVTGPNEHTSGSASTPMFGVESPQMRLLREVFFPAEGPKLGVILQQAYMRLGNAGGDGFHPKIFWKKLRAMIEVAFLQV